MLPQTVPEPVRTIAQAQENRRAVCEPRGYCGPFVNEAYFAAFNAGEWRGFGNCVYCGNTVDVSTHLERWEAALWENAFGVDLDLECGPPSRDFLWRG